MRLVQFTAAELKGAARAGVEVGAEVVDLCAAAGVQELSMRALLARGAEGLELARAAVRSGQHRRARDAIQLLAPITDPEKILCIGSRAPLGPPWRFRRPVRGPLTRALLQA
jgi:predicted NBD/HSP70 family sugar kinase